MKKIVPNDGSDGLAAGVAGTIALFFAGAQPHALGHVEIGIPCALLGAAAGFLVFNFPAPRASIFMGDSGSTTLGFTIAVLSLNFSDFADDSASSLLFPILIAGLPLGDAALAFVRRAKQRQSPLKGDRQHFYDIALSRGWSPRKVALVSYVITGLLCGIGWIGLRLPSRDFLILASLAFAILFVVALRLGSLGRDWGLAAFATVTLQEPFVAQDRKSSAPARMATPAGAGEAEVTTLD